MTSDSTWANRALEHARHIAERIGPRGSTTPEEKRTADYLQDQLNSLGLNAVRQETFRTPRSSWFPLAIAFSIAVWGPVICWASFYLTANKLIGALIGAALGLFSLWTFYQVIRYRTHVLRHWLPKTGSQNVIGQIAALKDARQRVVLVASLDTHPASWLFQTPRRTRVFRFLLGFSGFGLIVGIGMFVLGGFGLWPWAFAVGGACGLIISSGLLASILADQGDFSPGANVNASGLGSILALAERLQQNPLQQTEVWIVGVGSQEIGAEGLRDLIDRHYDELREAWFVGFEGVGHGKRLIFFTHEGPFNRSMQPAARELVQQLLAAQPDLSIEARSSRTRSTLLGPIHWRGLKGVCLSVFDDRNQIPYWRQHFDVAQHLQVTALKKTQDFAWALLQQIDRAG